MTIKDELINLFPEVNWDKYPNCTCCYPISAGLIPDEKHIHHPSCLIATLEISKQPVQIKVAPVFNQPTLL